MGGPIIGAFIGGTSPQFAVLEYTSNGIIVRYSEAAKRRKKVQSPIAGLDMSYIQMIMEMISAQMGGGEDWDDEKKSDRLDRMREILKSAKTPTDDKFNEVWVMESKSIFCPKVEDLPAAIKVAYDAYLGVLSLQRDGNTVYPDGYIS